MSGACRDGSRSFGPFDLGVACVRASFDAQCVRPGRSEIDRPGRGEVKLTANSANTLCKYVVERLAGWRALPAVLQAGGLESRASSRILLGREDWLAERQDDLLVVPEYRGQIDYALVERKSVGRSYLEVDTIIEVKFNYLHQSGCLQRRPLKAFEQLRGYRNRWKARHGYVLYIVASPVGNPPASSNDRDAGWRYFRRTRPEIKSAGPIDVPGVRVLAQYPSGTRGHEIACGNAVAELWACVLEEKQSAVNRVPSPTRERTAAARA